MGRGMVWTAGVWACIGLAGANPVFEMGFADGQGQFSNNSTLNQQTVDFILEANSTVELAVFNLSDRFGGTSVTDALIDRHNALGPGAVRVVVDTDAWSNGAVQDLLAAGVSVIDDQGDPDEMHHKFVVIDGQSVWTGTANFTDSGFSSQDNAALRINDPTIAAAYVAEFDEMWAGVFKEASPPTLTTDYVVAGRDVRVLWGAEDDPIDDPVLGLRSYVAAATTSVHFGIYVFTGEVGDPYRHLEDELVDLHNAGLTVRGVMNRGTMLGWTPYNSGGGPQFDDLGMDVRLLDTGDLLHTKIAVIDQDILAIGSANFTYSADAWNDENMVFLTDTAMARRGMLYLQDLHSQAQDEGTPASPAPDLTAPAAIGGVTLADSTGAGRVEVGFAPAPEADLNRYHVFVATQPITAADVSYRGPLDPALTVFSAGPVVVDTLSDGTPVPDGVDLYAAVVATDNAGNESVLGTFSTAGPARSIGCVGTDTDGDGVPDPCDACPSFDDAVDVDGDGVADGCDACPGFDDSLDTDADGTPDGCDVCVGGGSVDSDGDGVPDACDVCPSGDDTADGDGDGTPDACDACPLDNPNDSDFDTVCDSVDQCPGSLDLLDADGDGVPDGCDACPLDAGNDTDGDGVCDAADRCPGFDDAADLDGDGTPDGCDACPLDAANDSDGDGVCDADDVCPGFDDAVDGDGDGVADGCDACPLDAPDDSDGDGVCDADDVCPGFDDTQNRDGDFLPDGCDGCPDDNPDDSDGDGSCDSVDACPGGDDTRDGDGDGVPDDCDACPGFDDAVDGDGDGAADGCDPCPIDPLDDSDGDGSCDSVDACPGFDDTVDGDGDGAADACDPCPIDAPDDSDGDGVCDSVDACPGFDDGLDSDGDGRADGCDACPLDNPDDSDGDQVCDTDDVCPGGDDGRDMDGDTVPDFCDVCPGGDDRVDSDADGIPDDCETQTGHTGRWATGDTGLGDTGGMTGDTAEPGPTTAEPPPWVDTAEPTGPTTTDTPGDGDADKDAACGCQSTPAGGVSVGWLVALVAGLRRRRAR